MKRNSAPLRKIGYFFKRNLPLKIKLF